MNATLAKIENAIMAFEKTGFTENPQLRGLHSRNSSIRYRDEWMGWGGTAYLIGEDSIHYYYDFVKDADKYIMNLQVELYQGYYSCKTVLNKQTIVSMKQFLEIIKIETILEDVGLTDIVDNIIK
jgi:hypothetical protein